MITDMPQSVLDAIKTDGFTAHLITVNIGSNTLYFTEADHDIEFNGDTYLGNGIILGMGKPKYTAEPRVNETTVSFSGADLTINALLLNNNDGLNKRLSVDRVWLDSNGQVIGNYALRLNNWRIVGSSMKERWRGESIVSLKVASQLADWQKPRGRRTTPASQQRFYPGDKGFEFAASVQKELQWGSF